MDVPCRQDGPLETSWPLVRHSEAGVVLGTATHIAERNIAPAIMDKPSQEGTIPFNAPSVDTVCHTYYKVFGDLKNGTTPLVMLHGGPGSAHEYLLPYAELSQRHGIPMVFYDQIGCAASTHLRDKAGDEPFWQMSLFEAELDNLLQHLHLNDSDGPGYDLFGHSFGGMLAMSFAAQKPQGLRRLIVASSPTSLKLFNSDVWRLAAQLPPEHKQAIEKAVETKDFAAPEYLKALLAFERTFMCRAPDPYPPKDMEMRYKHQADDQTVRRTL